jgi:FKBP-type peptidyl-prolyl cis-trans isomerase (trigger factor)
LDPEKLREEYRTKAEQDLKLEFFLRKVADEEKITVEKEDIEKALASIENPTEREEIMKNPYLVASIIRQQKTISYLSSL